MGGNYLYLCMYVCMYTMILPLHFSVPIYSPWQKKKKKKKLKKLKEALGPWQGPNIYIYVWLLTPNLTSKGAGKLVTEMRDL